MNQPKDRLKELDVLHAFTMRDLIDRANSIHLQKEDLVTISKNDEEGYYLVYYK